MLTPEDLIQKDLDVISTEWLRRYDDFVKVTLHQLCDDVAEGRCQGEWSEVIRGRRPALPRRKQEEETG